MKVCQHYGLFWGTLNMTQKRDYDFNSHSHVGPREGRATKGTLLGTPNREHQEYSRNIIGIYLPGYLYSVMFLLYSDCLLFGSPIGTLLATEPAASHKTELISRKISAVAKLLDCDAWQGLVSRRVLGVTCFRLALSERINKSSC